LLKTGSEKRLSNATAVPLTVTWTGNGAPVTTSLIRLHPVIILKGSNELIFVLFETVKTTFVVVAVTVSTS